MANLVIPTIMIQIADFLNIIIFQSNFIHLNIWSLIHLAAGFFIMKIFLINKKNRMLKLFWLLVLYEIFELLTIYSGLSLFRVEIGRDIIWDILIGLLGGYLYKK